jgi:hypothetical protein
MDGRKIKTDLQEMGCENRLDSGDSEYGPVEGTFEYSNVILGSIKKRGFLDQLRHCKLLKKFLVP